jgi:hypothetical protein
MAKSMNPTDPRLEGHEPGLKASHVVFVQSENGKYLVRIDNVKVVSGQLNSSDGGA